MSLPIFALRPEPGAAATVAAGRERGLEIAAVPLFAIRPVAWSPPAPEALDALLIGSANAIRHAGAGVAAFGHLPVYAVGEATAAAAREAGFTVAATGEGGLQALLERTAPPLRLLRLAGAEHVPLTPPAGIELVMRVVYRADPQPLPAAAAARLGNGAVVLLHSAAAARHFADECDRMAVPRGAVRLAALGPRIAVAAGTGWGAVAVAAHPAEPPLLALAAELCHD
ncbi:MAG: uroporphyrinogen III synthase [Sphingomonadales bacterium 32-68-7]|nr:MAG: uroporphyrinogen III synthase [Sphingomonadales bacterium 12-68-11]OYX08085.1 MAG: uroporphyrinogen III synthase [Sphingomonadales bacterium 32-68-7]